MEIERSREEKRDKTQTAGQKMHEKQTVQEQAPAPVTRLPGFRGDGNHSRKLIYIGGSMNIKNLIPPKDHTKKVICIDGHEIVVSFSDEPKPETFQTVKRILLQSSSEKEIDIA